MAVFNNASEVQNQTGQQIINGDVNFYAQGSSSNERRKLNSKQGLDEAILESLAFSEMSYRRLNVQSPYKNTCEWILNHTEYRKWDASISGLLWIKGKPGAGKSTLMPRLYRQFRHQMRVDSVVLLEFFFNARGTDLQRTPLGMFRSLLNQVFYQDRGIRKIVREPYRDKHAALGAKGSDLQWQLFELESLMTEALLACSLHQRILIFIDALDEAGEQAAREVVRYFHALNDDVARRSARDEHVGLKICISCRHYPVTSFCQANQIHMERHNFDDIKSYVNSNLAIDSSSTVNDAPNSKQWQDLAQYIVNAARGIFQWVRLIIQLIEQRRARGDSPKMIRQWMSRVPKDLGRVYEHILTEVVDQGDTIRCLWLFQWVCLAFRPLTLAQLQQTLHAHKTDTLLKMDIHIESVGEVKMQIQGWSGGLIELDTSQHLIKIQVIHHLCEPGIELHTEPGQHVDITKLVQSYQGHLYQFCLNYMEIFSRKEEAFLAFNERHLNDPFNDFHRMRKPEEYSLIGYVVENLFNHARAAERHRGLSRQAEIEILGDIASVWRGFASIYRYAWELVPLDAMSPLYLAAFAGLEDLVDYMLEKDAEVDVDERVLRRQIALSGAIASDHLAVVEKLISSGADLGAEGLNLAAKSESMKTFELFFDKCVRDNNFMVRLAETLCAEAGAGATAVVEACIKAGADVNFHNISHDSALCAAARSISRKAVGTVHLLLDAGANVNLRSGPDNTTALYAAVSSSYNLSIIRTLIEAGANINDPSITHNLEGSDESGLLEMPKTLSEGHDRFASMPYLLAQGRLQKRRRKTVRDIIIEARARVAANLGD